MPIKPLLILLCAALALSSSFAADDSNSGPTANNAVLLLNVISEGPLSARDLVFTNADTGEELWIRNLLRLSRLGSTRYIVEELPAGQYYLSSIYPTYNGNDSASRIDVDKSSGLITVLPDTINYIGDVVITSKETGRGITTTFTYQPDSKTLVAAATGERELFLRLNTVVSIAGNKPVAVDPRLLGL